MTPRSRRARVPSIALFAVLVLPACGPLGYIKNVAKDASLAVAEAKSVGAEELAPYEYWSAVTYLQQAKTMAAYSEYERSFDYGARAKQLAADAKRKAQEREAARAQKATGAAP